MRVRFPAWKEMNYGYGKVLLVREDIEINCYYSYCKNRKSGKERYTLERLQFPVLEARKYEKLKQLREDVEINSCLKYCNIRKIGTGRYKIDYGFRTGRN